MPRAGGRTGAEARGRELRRWPRASVEKEGTRIFIVYIKYVPTLPTTTRDFAGLTRTYTRILAAFLSLSLCVVAYLPAIYELISRGT